MDYKCELKERAVQPTLAIRTRSAVQDLSQVLGQSYGAIMQYMCELDEQPAGAPFVAYYNMDMQDLDIEIGFPVAKKLAGKGNIQASEIPAGKFATCMHIGPYDQVEAAYNALMKWIEENGYEAAGVAYETYLNDPSETPPEQLQTLIMFPLK